MKKAAIRDAAQRHGYNYSRSLVLILVNELREASNEGILRAFRDANRFTTFKIFRRPGAL